MQINMLGYFVDYYYLFFSFSIGDKRFLNNALWEFAYLKFDHKMLYRVHLTIAEIRTRNYHMIMTTTAPFIV